jgi:hypothetical protein
VTTKEEASEALDRAAQEYASVVFAEDGTVGMVQWVLVAHVDILETDESGYTQAVSPSLALHNRLGLLRYATVHSDNDVLSFADVGDDEV